MARPPKADYVPLIVAAARRQLEASDDVNITAIAKELGISPALVHFYVGGREALLVMAWREIFMAFVHDDQAAVAEAAANEDWEGLGDIVEAVFAPDRDEAHRSHIRAAAEAQRSPSLAELLDESTGHTVELWTRTIEAGIEAGIARTDLDPESIARLIVGAALGVTVACPTLDDRQRQELARTWTAMLRAVMQPGYRPPGH
jgi:AcrR family transcriptional regulator